MARQFTDKEGRDWTLDVNAVTLGIVEERLGVDFTSEHDDKSGPVIRIATDCIFAFRVLYVLCEAQADSRGVKDMAFGSMLVGDTLGKAQDELCKVIADFNPDPDKRAAILRTFAIIKNAEKELIRRANNQLDQINVSDIVDEVMEGGGSDGG